MTGAEKKRRVTADRIAKGLCVQCGNASRPLVTTRYCQRCYELRKANDSAYKRMRRERMKSVQFCYRCGNAEVKAFTVCLACRNRCKTIGVRWLHKKREPCIKCGVPRSHTAITKMCRACAYKYVWHVKMRAKRDAKRKQSA